MKTIVYKRDPPVFGMGGNFLYYPLKRLEENIAEGLARRLYLYALKRAKESGFEFLNTWECEVGTSDGDEKPSNRGYFVKFTNSKNGFISLTNILTRNGYPTLDHSWEIGEE